MRCVPRHCALLLSLAVAASGCGGREGGPRGETSGGGRGESAVQEPATPPSMRTVVYVPSYGGNLTAWTERAPFKQFNYVNLSFATVDVAGNVSYPDVALPWFVDAAHQAGVKVCIAIGGAGTIADGGVYTTLLQDAQRPAFVDKLVAFVSDNQLDCLDVDLEGNGVNEFYEKFVTELGTKLKPRGKELTAAVAAWFGDRITDTALAQFDFVNVMAYDLYFQRETPMQWSSLDAATREVDKWVARGLPRDRVVYGVPFYGVRWSGGRGEPAIIGYRSLLEENAAAATQDQLELDGSITYLNSRATIQAKAQLAKTYGGIMAWELSQDAPGNASLLRAIREVVP